MTATRPPRWRAAAVLLAALVGAAIAARLGLWQLDRAGQKTALAHDYETRAAAPELPASALARTAVEAQAQHYRRIALRGRWLADATVFLDNRPMDGRAGFIVVTPLMLAPGDAVLVQRGWVPRDVRDRSALPALPTPAGDVEVLGRIAPPPSRLLEFAPDANGPIRQNLDVDRRAREIGVALRPLSLLQVGGTGSAEDGLLRDWAPASVDAAKNQGYALQWFSLCALITGLYVWFQLVRPRLRRPH